MRRKGFEIFIFMLAKRMQIAICKLRKVEKATAPPVRKHKKTCFRTEQLTISHSTHFAKNLNHLSEH